MIPARFAKICWIVEEPLFGILAQISADQEPLRLTVPDAGAVTIATAGEVAPERTEGRGRYAISGANGLKESALNIYVLLKLAAVISEPVYVPTCVAPIDPEFVAVLPEVSFSLYQTAGVVPVAIAAA